MRPAAKFLVGVALLFVVALAVPTAQATTECEQMCLDRWTAAKADCQRVLEQKLAALDVQAQNCMNETDPLKIGLCLQNVNIKKAQAAGDYRRCIGRANTLGWNCYRQNCISKHRP